jgi:peptide deformylase
MFYNNKMALLEIKKYPEKILKQKTTPIDNIDSDTQQLIENMLDTMHAARGIGLAANQVGILKSLCVVDTSQENENNSIIVLINPLIIEKEGSIESAEGCLSIPGCSTGIKRAERVYVSGLDRNGKPINIEGTGLLARALQHEIDHLDGLLIFDRMSPIKREFFRRRYKKLLRSSASTE